MSRPNCILIMDGYGINPDREGNAIAIEGSPNIKKLWEKYPHTQLGASGRDVGLPDGQMGNSEVGASEHRRGQDRLSGVDPHHEGNRGRGIF